MTAVAAAGFRDRWRLGVAAIAVMLAAADTYVVVLALLSMMRDLGIGVEHLEKATPIISGFLLGYVALLPLLGRLSDIAGRGPVLGGCLIAFAAGSVITASSHDLFSTVAGRLLQGMGGGGLVPVTLAIVADSWPEQRRGVPLGVVGAVQELGSVLGPLYGAAIISVTSWRVIFWINVPLALLLGGAFALAGGGRARTARWRRDLVGTGLGAAALISGGLAVAAPAPLTESVSWGLLYTPLAGDSGLTDPIVLAAFAFAAAWLLRESLSAAAAIPLRRLPAVAARLDAAGALLLAVVLGCIVITFASSDPSVEVVSSLAWVLLPAAAVALVALVLWERRSPDPIVPAVLIRRRGAWGSLLTNLAVGAGLIAALVDVPVFARATSEPDSQVGAALVLLRFLAGVPIGALVGGALSHRAGNRLTASLGMALAAAMFTLMAGWDATSLGHGVRASDIELAAGGLGFGLAIAPVNAAMFAAVPAALHGLGASLVVVARLMGMLVGISLLTVIGLHAFDASAGSLTGLCPPGRLTCPAYDAALTRALLSELRAIFAGAAVACALAAAAAITTLGGRSRA